MTYSKQEKERMLARIYEEMASKELSFGCKYKYKPRGRMIFTVDSEQIRTNLNLSLVQSLGHPVMIGDCLDWIEKNVKSNNGLCPKCGGNISYQEGQQSFPETGQWDFPSSYYCEDKFKKECNWSSEYDKEWHCGDDKFEAIWELTYGEFNNEPLWKSKRLPIDEQSDECVSYIHSLIK